MVVRVRDKLDTLGQQLAGEVDGPFSDGTATANEFHELVKGAARVVGEVQVANLILALCFFC